MPRHLQQPHLRNNHHNRTEPTTSEPRPRSGLGLVQATTTSQFQTPPSRNININIPQLHPSSGALETADTMHPAAAAQAAIFSLFGRGVSGRQRAPVTDIHPAEEDEEGLYEEAEEEIEIEDEDEGDEDDEEDSQYGEIDERGYAHHRRRRRREREHVPLDAEANEIDIDISGDDMDGLGEDDLEDDLEEDEMMQDQGCGVAALRHPSPTQYWQSDGPQPHTLTLHFFKLVAVVKIRVYLDCEMDESYTPTKMTFLAGMGGNDLVEFAVWEGEGPCGWVDVSLEGVGGRDGGWVCKRRKRRVRKGEKSRSMRYATSGCEEDKEEDGEEDGDEIPADDDDDDDDEDDPYAGNVLKAMVIQMRVIENHQNGKDTHVRGFQVFARDDERRRMGNAPSASADSRVRRHSARKSLRGGANDDGTEGHEAAGDLDRGKVVGLEAPDWMGEPVIR
ncbi:hypothetical protein EYZ11_002716 [Aspergillus tanneri]|uniref:DOC domain-containing protein n=1 Tax=Aspergillus tanneri TaxID=1220188 RepID=A0A4S3JQR7_9EURO|nr:hypothetical protein EYZ11_002716 [Aspergillus tanneri]